jgi:hypothetical protein
MDNEGARADKLLYWFFAALGGCMVFASFWIRTSDSESVWVDLLLNVGATLISTAVLAFLYQRFGSENLMRQITQMRNGLIIAERSVEVGLRDMWRERRHIPSQMWNSFTMKAQSEVWLLGVAELGFAEDSAFHDIVSGRTARGCNYRFLLLDPGSPVAEALDQKEGGGRQVQGRIRRALHEFELMRTGNAGKRGQIEIRLYAEPPQVSVVRSDDELLVTPYMMPLNGDSCLTMRVQRVPEGVFYKYIHHFESLWMSAQRHTAAKE